MPPSGHKHLFLLFFLFLLGTLALEAGAEAGRGGRRRNSGRRDNFFANQEEASVQEEEEEGKLYFDKAKAKDREGKCKVFNFEIKLKPTSIFVFSSLLPFQHRPIPQLPLQELSHTHIVSFLK